MSIEVEPDRWASRYWQGVRIDEDGNQECRFLEHDFNRDMEAWVNRKKRVKLLEYAIISLVGRDALKELDKMIYKPNLIEWSNYWKNNGIKK